MNPIQAAIDELRVAFPPRPLDVNGAFDEWGRTYLDVQQFQADANRKRWDELPTPFLEFHHNAPLHLGPPVSGDVLPAYLAAALRRDPGLDMLPSFLIDALTRGLDGNDKRFDAQFGSLTTAQRAAVARALDAWHGSVEDPKRQRSITDALNSYWRSESRESGESSHASEIRKYQETVDKCKGMR
jgi:hypothetical protein